MPTSQEIAATAGTPLWDANAYVAALVFEENQRKAQSQPAQISPQEDARLEQIKHDQAFHSGAPRDDRNLPQSAEFYAINQQYAASRNQVVTSGGSVYQGPVSNPNPYDPNTAAGIAYEVAKTGGGTDKRMNAIAERQVIAQGGDPSFIRYATDIYVERPSFQQETLTTKTGQTFVNEAWAGVPIRLNLTRDEMAGFIPNPSKTYLNYNQDTFMLDRFNPTAAIGIDPGVHTKFGDFGGPILQRDGSYGGWTPSSGRLVGGNKVAAFGERVDATSPQNVEVLMAGGALPKPFMSGDSQTVIEAPTGEVFGYQIPYVSGAIAFFQPGKSITTRESTAMLPEVTTLKETKVTPFEGGVLTTSYYETTGGKTVTSTKTETDTPSGFDVALLPILTPYKATEKYLSEKIPFSGEQLESGARTATLLNPLTTGFAVPGYVLESAKKFGAPISQDTIEGVRLAEPLKGQASAFKEAPLAIGASYTIGALVGGGARVVGAGYNILARAPLAEAAISSGGKARTVLQTADFVTDKAIPVALGSIYAFDIVARSTKGFTEWGVSSIQRAKVIGLQEAAPMTVGAIQGYRLPDAIYGAGKTAYAGLKQAPGYLSEKATAAYKSVPTINQIRYKIVEMREPASAISRPMPSERFATAGTKPTGTISSSRFVEAARASERSGFGRSRSGGTGAVSSKDTPRQASLKSNYNPLAPLTELKPPSSSITPTAISGIRGTLRGRWDQPKSAVEDSLKNLPLKERWKIREGSISKGGTGGYYGSGTPTGNLQSGVGIGGSSVRSGGQTLEIRGLSSGMGGLKQDLAPQRLEILPSRRTATRMRAEDLAYEYESRQLPPGIKRPAPSESKILMEQTPVSEPISKQLVATSPLSSMRSLSSTSSITSQLTSSSLLSVQSVALDMVSQKAQKQSALQVPSVLQIQRTGQIQTPSLDQIASTQIRSDVRFDQAIINVPKSLTVTQPFLVTTPVVTPTTIYDTRTTRTPTTKITTDTWYDPIKIITPVPIVTPPGVPFPPSGGSSSPFGRKRRYNFMEVFNFGLDISGPIASAPRGMKPPRVKRSGLPGGKQKVKVSRKKRK